MPPPSASAQNRSFCFRESGGRNQNSIEKFYQDREVSGQLGTGIIVMSRRLLNARHFSGREPWSDIRTFRSSRETRYSTPDAGIEDPGWPSISTGRSDPPLNSVTPLCLLLILRHFAERGCTISDAHPLSFQRFPDGKPVALFSCVGVRQKGERQ